MAKTDFKSVDEYISTQPVAVKPILEQVRSVIRKALPDAVEVISYQIPAYKLPGGTALFFAGWKKHYSLYPASDKLVVAFRGDLSSLRVSKGTIRFPLSEPVSEDLIGRIAAFRGHEIAEVAKAKATVPRQP